MDRQQAEQEVTLVKVSMETGSLEVSHGPKGSQGWIKCTVAFVAGLIVAVVVGIILHYFVFTPSCNQDAPAPTDTPKVRGTYKLQMISEGERYDIFTADKATTYLIYGWVKVPHVTKENFVLKQIRDSTITIDTYNTSTTEMFLFNKVKLADNTSLSLSFKSTYTDNLFHVYEL